jgi:ribosomal protein S6
MTVYDSTFILNPQLEEGGLDASIKDAVDLITAHGGKIVKENRIGMRRMAYEIQKITLLKEAMKRFSSWSVNSV